jgi:hypothetical protein
MSHTAPSAQSAPAVQSDKCGEAQLLEQKDVLVTPRATSPASGEKADQSIAWSSGMEAQHTSSAAQPDRLWHSNCTPLRQALRSSHVPEPPDKQHVFPVPHGGAPSGVHRWTPSLPDAVSAPPSLEVPRLSFDDEPHATRSPVLNETPNQTIMELTEVRSTREAYPKLESDGDGGGPVGPLHVPVGRMIRSTGVPFDPVISGKNTRWVAGSTATECELLPGESWPMSTTPGCRMSNTVRSPLSAAT